MKKPLILFTLCGLTAAAGWWLGRPAAASLAGKSGRVLPVMSPVSGARAATAGADKADPLSLFSLAPADYPERLKEAVNRGWADEVAWLAHHWAARDPEGLFAFLMAPEGLDFCGPAGGNEVVTTACFEVWFKKDLPAALAAMGRLRGTNTESVQCGVYLIPALGALFRLNPEAAVKYLGEHPDFTQTGLYSYTDLRNCAGALTTMPPCRARAGLLSRALKAMIMDQDGAKGEAAAKAWLATLTPEMRMEALRLAEPGGRNECFVAAKRLMVSGFSEEELTALATAKTGEAGRQLLAGVARTRAMKDPAAAAAWAMNSLDGMARQEALRAILDVAAPGTVAEAGLFLEGIPTGPLRDKALWAIADRLRGEKDYQKAMDWALTLSDPGDQRKAMGNMMANWTLNDPKASLAWVRALPEGPAQLAAATAALGYDFATSVRYAGELPEPLGLAAVKAAWANLSFTDARPLADSAAQQPPGALREWGMERAGHDMLYFFHYRYGQEWLDWAERLPTPVDRAAALRGAESHGQEGIWAAGIREAARAKLEKARP